MFRSFVRTTRSSWIYHHSNQLSPYRFLSTMADLKVDLTAPNGKKFTLPTGLFINNEFVKSSSGAKITSINPTWVENLKKGAAKELIISITGMNKIYARLRPLASKISTRP